MLRQSVNMIWSIDSFKTLLNNNAFEIRPRLTGCRFTGAARLYGLPFEKSKFSNLESRHESEDLLWFVEKQFRIPADCFRFLFQKAALTSEELGCCK